MTHVVAGYRTLKETERLVKVMEDSGVDFVEIQIPFSDPIGDGSTITHANQYALDHGITVARSLQFFEETAKKVSVPLFVMTYMNIAYMQGLDTFFRRLVDIGAQGVIIPDLAYASHVDKDSYFAQEEAARVGIPIIPVISPNTSVEKMRDISERMKELNNNCMVYCTQRTGITGTHEQVVHTSDEHRRMLWNYLTNAREVFSCDIAGGFGIRSKKQVQELSELLDVAVIGSHIMNMYRELDVKDKVAFSDALQNIQQFLSELKK